MEMFFSCLGTIRKQAGSIVVRRVVDFDYQYKAQQIASENGVSHYYGCFLAVQMNAVKVLVFI